MKAMRLKFVHLLAKALRVPIRISDEWWVGSERQKNTGESGARDLRLMLRLSPEAKDALTKLSARRSEKVSFAEVIRRAIGTELFLLDEVDRGSRVLIEDAEKNIRQVIL